jgi:hypothetical protein
MKYLFLCVAMLAMFSLFVAKQTSAAPTFIPFGNKVATITNGAVICAPPGIGPIYLMSLNPLDATMPYYAPNVSLSAPKIPRPGGYILGLYLSIPNPGVCYTDVGTPYPVKQITIYGVSR